MTATQLRELGTFGDASDDDLRRIADAGQVDPKAAEELAACCADSKGAAVFPPSPVLPPLP